MTTTTGRSAPGTWWRARLSALWPTASLSAYLVAIILIATVPIAILMALQIYEDVAGDYARIEQEVQRAAAATAQNVERELASSIDALTILAHTNEVQSGDYERLHQVLRERPWQRSSWSSMFLIDGDGTVLFETEPGAAGEARSDDGERRSVRHRTDFQQLVANAVPTVSNLETSGTDRPFRTAIAVPVVSDGRLRFVLGAWIDVSVWQELLQKSGPPARGFLGLSDRDHRVIARTLHPDRMIGMALPADLAAVAELRSTGLQRFTLLEGGPAYGAWQLVPSAGWGVDVGLPAEPVDAAHRASIARALTTAALCLVLGLWLAFLVARHLTQPLHQLSTSGLGQPFGRIAVREVAKLRDALFAAHAQDEAARRRLQDTANEFETLFNGSPIGLAFARDPQCLVVTHNAAMDALFGPAVPPAGTPPVQILYQGRPLERSQRPLQRAAALGETVAPMELEIAAPGQATRHVLAQAVPLHDGTGQPRGAISAVVDITERKLGEARLASADARLRESQRLVDLAQEAGHVGFFHYQFERDLLSWTQGQSRLFGVAPQTFESPLDAWVRLIDPEDRVRVERGLRRVVQSRQEKETFEYRVAARDGPPVRWLSSRVLLMYGPGGRPEQMVGVTVDVTDDKEAQHERALLNEREKAARLEAEAANRAKDEFLAMLGHELRNPLSAIASAVEVLNRVDSGTELAANARRIAARQTQHLARLMDDLLDVGRVISGKVILSRRPVNLAQLAQRVVSTLEVTGESGRHDLQLGTADAWVDADATRIEQVLTNLVNNALKYTPPGGRVEIATAREGDDAVLRVRDNGAGIPEELLPRVFDLFVQGERTPDRRAGGLGIGLTLVRRLVELHGGHVAAESSSAGSVFTVRLPAIAAPTPANTHARIPESRRRRVLVIEDNEDALAGLRAMLELDGHTVASATDGVQGLQLVMDMRPDVAIVDIGLPGLTGLEVAQRSRAAGFPNRMIAVSGYGQHADVQRALKAGFDAHLVKPVDADSLQRLLVEG